MTTQSIDALFESAQALISEIKKTLLETKAQLAFLRGNDQRPVNPEQAWRSEFESWLLMPGTLDLPSNVPGTNVFEKIYQLDPEIAARFAYMAARRAAQVEIDALREDKERLDCMQKDHMPAYIYYKRDSLFNLEPQFDGWVCGGHGDPKPTIREAIDVARGK